MSPEPLTERIKGCLALQPMTTRQIARCLSVTEDAVRKNMPEETRVIWRERTNGRPFDVQSIRGITP